MHGDMFTIKVKFSSYFDLLLEEIGFHKLACRLNKNNEFPRHSFMYCSPELNTKVNWKSMIANLPFKIFCSVGKV